MANRREYAVKLLEQEYQAEKTKPKMKVSHNASQDHADLFTAAVNLLERLLPEDLEVPGVEPPMVPVTYFGPGCEKDGCWYIKNGWCKWGKKCFKGKMITKEEDAKAATKQENYEETKIMHPKLCDKCGGALNEDALDLGAVWCSCAWMKATQPFLICNKCGGGKNYYTMAKWKKPPCYCKD